MVAAVSFLFAIAPAKPHIVSISIFKNGYAFVTREVETEPGTTELPPFGRVTEGTIWFYAPKDVHLDALTSSVLKEKTTITARTILELLRLNVGKKVTIELSTPDKRTMTGKVRSVSDQLLTIETEAQRSVVMVQNVLAVHGEADLQDQLEAKTESRIIRVRTSGAAGKLRYTTLEAGIMWTPTYAVKVLDSKNLSLTARASVWNELEDLAGAAVRFVTGFPNVGSLASPDMLAAGDFATYAGVPYDFRDTRGVIGGEAKPTIISNAPVGGLAVTTSSNADGSSFIGGTNETAVATLHNSRTPSTPAEVNGTLNFQNANVGAHGTGNIVEDLYFFHQPNVELLKGERGYFSLFTTNATYERLHTAIVSDDEARSEGSTINVWQTLRFKNPSDKPCSGGTASIFENNELMGQDTVSYIPPHGDIELQVSQARSIVVEAKEREVARDRGALQITKTKSVDRLTLTGSIVITNHKADTIKIKVKRPVTGEVLAHSGGKFTSTARGTFQRNPSGEIEWTESIGAGKSVTLTYKYTQFATE